jgi:hypothetical protein
MMGNSLTEKFRREEIRWRILLTLYTNAPLPTKQDWVVSAVVDLELQTNRDEVIGQVAYLAGKELVEAVDRGRNGIFLVLTPNGVDYCEYATPELPGITRPEI